MTLPNLARVLTASSLLFLNATTIALWARLRETTQMAEAAFQHAAAAAATAEVAMSTRCFRCHADEGPPRP